MTQSFSPTPWKAPAIKGLSSTALQNTTNFAQPKQSCSFVNSAVCSIISPIFFTASIFKPFREVPIFTEEQTTSVSFNDCGIELIKISSDFVQPFCTNAENPPIKFTPTALAALSKVCAILT